MQYFNEFCFSKFFRCSAAIEPEQEPVPEPVKGPEFIPKVGRLARFNFSSFLLKKTFHGFEFALLWIVHRGLSSSPACPYQIPIDGRVDEPRVRVPVHEGVDLELGLVERVLGRRDHVAIDDLADAGVKTDLKWKDDIAANGSFRPA